MKQLSTVLIATLTISYPFAVYFGLLHFDPRWLALMLIALLSLRLWVTGWNKQNSTQWAIVIAMGALLWSVLTDQAIGLKLYPVIISLSMLALFAWSLRHPPPIIERIARRMETDFPDSAIPYTYKVTQAWCLFFAINGAIALYTALWGSMALWILYNGLISYLIMGTLFAGEWLIRQRIKRNYHA